MVPEKSFRRNKTEKIRLIVEAYLDLLAERGYHQTTTNHVAEVAGVSIGTVYRYFPGGKEEILLRAFDQARDLILAPEEFASYIPERASQVFRPFIERYIKNKRQNPQRMLAFRQAIESEKKILEAYRARIRTTCEELVHSLQTTSSFFRAIPTLYLIDRFVWVYNYVEAVIYHHIIIMPLFDNDGHLLSFLVDNLTSMMERFQATRDQ